MLTLSREAVPSLPFISSVHFPVLLFLVFELHVFDIIWEVLSVILVTAMENIELDVSCLPLTLSIVFFETGSLTKSRTWQFPQNWLASNSPGSTFLPGAQSGFPDASCLTWLFT